LILGPTWKILWAKSNGLRAEKEGVAQLLLRFAISHPALCTTIIDTKSQVHLAENIKAVETGPLPNDVLAVTVAVPAWLPAV